MQKRKPDVINSFKETQPALSVCKTPIGPKKMAIKTLWGKDINLSGGQTNSRGVAILLNNNFEYEVLKCRKDKNKNLLNLILKLSTII